MSSLTFAQRCDYVAGGLSLKYWAMWILLSVPLIIGLVAALGNTHSLIWLAFGCLSTALLMDCAGRILCLIGDMTASRMLFVSTAVQVAAILLSLASIPLIGGWCLYFLLTGQLIAALSFTSYLRQLAEYFQQPHLQIDANLLGGKVVAASGMTIMLGLAIGFVLVLTVFGLFTFYLGGFLLPIVGALMSVPVIMVWLITAIRMFTGYGILLVGLRSAILEVRSTPVECQQPS